MKLDLSNNKRYHLSTGGITAKGRNFNGPSQSINLNLTYKQYEKETRIKLSDGSITWAGGRKPEGLWYAFGREWLDYDGEIANDEHLCPLFELELNIDKMLLIKSGADIEKFSRQYAENNKDTVRLYSYSINWRKVVKDYSGIEINPYVSPEECRAELITCWYWGWDVAGGCVWDLNSIVNVRRINPLLQDRTVNAAR